MINIIITSKSLDNVTYFYKFGMESMVNCIEIDYY